MDKVFLFPFLEILHQIVDKVFFFNSVWNQFSFLVSHYLSILPLHSKHFVYSPTPFQTFCTFSYSIPINLNKPHTQTHKNIFDIKKTSINFNKTQSLKKAKLFYSSSNRAFLQIQDSPLSNFFDVKDKCQRQRKS